MRPEPLRAAKDLTQGHIAAIVLDSGPRAFHSASFLMGAFQKTHALETFRQQDAVWMEAEEPGPPGAVFVPVNWEKSQGSVLVLFLSPLSFQWLRQVPKTLSASVGIAACKATSIEILIVCEVRGLSLSALTCHVSFLSSLKAHKLPPTSPGGPSSLELKL